MIDMVVNLPKNLTAGELTNGYKIRCAVVDLNVPLLTNARLVFELEYLESLPDYKPIKLNIFNTFRDTVLGSVIETSE